MSKLLDSAAVFAAAYPGPILLSSIAKSIRWTNLQNLEDETYWECSEAGIGAFWHDQQLMMPWSFLNFKGESDKDMYMLISSHHDGRLVAAAVEKIGIKTIAGSSTRGGKEALFKLASKIRDGNFVAITPDGPKGPRHKAKQGVIKLAQLTEAPIYPSAIAVKHAWEFSSWDRMRLAKPFTKGARIVGDPFYVPRRIKQSQIDDYTTKLEQELSELTIRVEAEVQKQ
ncbi:MAG: lysophospholipid acyltransferase family protein [Bdellovibrionota bacterium]